MLPTWGTLTTTNANGIAKLQSKVHMFACVAELAKCSRDDTTIFFMLVLIEMSVFQL